MADAKRKLIRLHLNEVSLVDDPANPDARVLLLKRNTEKATWDTAFINNLPDSSFAVVEGGGKKDSDGKTVPRSLRHLPYKDASGKVDLPHLRNALARLPQSDLSADLKARAQTKLEAAAREAGVGDSNKGNNMMNCPECDAQVSKSDTYCKKCGEKLPMAKTAGEGNDMNEDKLKADLAAAETLVDETNVKLEAAEKRAKDAEEKLAKYENSPEEVEKRKVAALPESIQKQMKEQAEEIKKLRDEKVSAEMIAKVKSDLGGLAVKAEEFGPILKRAQDSLSTEDYKALEETLKSASEIAKKSLLFREVGKGGFAAGGSADPEAQLLAKAAEIRKANPKLTVAEASVQAAAENPELYQAAMEADRKYARGQSAN